MKDLSNLIVACAACATGASGTIRGRRRRRMHANSFAERLTHTKIFSASLPVLVPREDADSPSSGAAPCSSPSAEWLRGLLRDVTEEDESNFFDWHLHTLPFAYKLFVEPERRHENEEYFGLDGEYTKEIESVHERAREFWSDSGVEDDIRVLCAHGSDLADRHNKLIPTLEVMFSNSYDVNYTVFDHASDIQDLILRLPGGYDFPLLTFNAFATYESDQHDSPSIMIGDGYFAFQRSAGLGSEGPEYALAHEHAHHLQVPLGVHDEENEDPSESDRRKELMADAFSAYFLAHDGGGDMTGEELANIHKVAYSVGDCEVGKDSHHGTPQERRCATKWGASVGDSRDHPTLDLVELKERFDVWYDSVDELDDACRHSDPAGSRPMPIPRGLLVAAIVFGGVVIIVASILIRRRVSRKRVSVAIDDAPKLFRTNSSPNRNLSVSINGAPKVFRTNSSTSINI